MLDMFGSGLPVLALSYPAITEILEDGENGHLFGYDSDTEVDTENSHKIDLCSEKESQRKLPTLFDCLVKVFCREKSRDTLDNLRRTVMGSNIQGWEETWSLVLEPVLARNRTCSTDNVKGKKEKSKKKLK
jgi:hypothetical protein